MSNNSDTEGTSHDKPEELPTQPPPPMEATEAPDSSGSGHGGAAQEESKEAGKDSENLTLTNVEAKRESDTNTADDATAEAVECEKIEIVNHGDDTDGDEDMVE